MVQAANFQRQGLAIKDRIYRVVKDQRPVSFLPFTPAPATPANATHSVDTVTSMSFTSAGKLKLNLANPPGSTGFYIFNLPVSPSDAMGPYQFCNDTLNAGGPIC